MYPNETHPEEFKVLTRAYKTLMDPEKRNQYDREMNDDGSFGEDYREAEGEYNEGNYFRALYLFENLLRSYPDNLDVQQYIALCYFEFNRYEDAIRLLEKLESAYPGIKRPSHYWVGRITSGRYNQAKLMAKRLININPYESNYYLRLSNIHFELKEYDAAIDILEKRLKNKVESVHDFPLLSELYFITMATGNHHTYHERESSGD